jgi:cytochrome b561
LSAVRAASTDIAAELAALCVEPQPPRTAIAASAAHHAIIILFILFSSLSGYFFTANGG